MGPACGLTVSVVRACGDSLRVDWRVYTLLNSSDTIVASVRTQHRRVPPTLHAGSHRHRHCARGCVYACVVRADARFRVGLVAGVARANESSKRMWVCRHLLWLYVCCCASYVFVHAHYPRTHAAQAGARWHHNFGRGCACALWRRPCVSARPRGVRGGGDRRTAVRVPHGRAGALCADYALSPRPTRAPPSCPRARVGTSSVRVAVACALLAPVHAPRAGWWGGCCGVVVVWWCGGGVVVVMAVVVVL